MDIETQIKNKYTRLKRIMNENQLRMFLGAEAEALGHGGISLVARATGVSRPTIHKGIKDLDNSDFDSNRGRREGGGRKKTTSKFTSVLFELESLLEPNILENPTAMIRWTMKGQHQLSRELADKGFKVSYPTVGDMLRSLGYTLKQRKRIGSRTKHPNPQDQFTQLTEAIIKSHKQKTAVIALRGCKSENKQRIHSSEKSSQGVAHKQSDRSTVTALLAGLNIWWHDLGSSKSHDSGELLICSDVDYDADQVNIWKKGLQDFANKTHLIIAVCHMPNSTYKWFRSERFLTLSVTEDWPNRVDVNHNITLDIVLGADDFFHEIQSTASTQTAIEHETQNSNNLDVKEHACSSDWNYSIRPKINFK